MTSRIRKITYSTIAGVGLFAGAAGLSAAATGNGPDQAPLVTPAADTDADDSGINCENGIDTATDKECDGGPDAAEKDEETEAPDNETEDDPAAATVNGLVAAPAGDSTLAEQVKTNETEEADSDDVEYEAEGEEVGENGDGVADADDLNETEADD